MACLMLASCKQRLAQVGTCLVAGTVRRNHRSTSSLQCGRTLCISSSGEIVLDRKEKSSKFNFDPTGRCFHTSVGVGPLSSTALVRRGKVVDNDPNDEYRELLEESSGLKERMEEVRHAMGRTLITVPLHLEKRLERKLKKDTQKRAIRQAIIDQSREGRKSKIIINCKRREFNHYHGQSYERNKDVPLASGKWKNKKSAGDHFTLFPGLKRGSSFCMSGAESVSFHDLGICETLCDNLKNLGVEGPTHIQVFGIPQLLKGGYNVVAAETGCGKTLAYLLPIFHQLIEDRRLKVRQKPAHPSTVILAPSRELADQIYNVALQLAYNLNITIKLLQGGNLSSKLKNPPQSTTVDILIATSNALKVLTSAGTYGTGKISHVVLDEADTLLDDSFFPELVGPFLNQLSWGDVQRKIQLTLVSATMPNGLNDTLGQILKMKEFHYCTTPGLHYSMPHVTQKFLRVMKSHKPEIIKKLVQSDIEDKIPLLIFCNKSQTCDWMSHYLNDQGVDCASVHGRMHPKYRRGRIDMYQRGEINVLIATDLASRGIDTVRTQHVINYEFPIYLADYIHRCGRTGRVGSEKGCKVTSFVARPGEVDTVNEIERSVRKEMALPDVNANIKRLYGQKYGSFVEIQPIQDEDSSRDEEQQDSGSASDDENSDCDSSDTTDNINQNYAR